MTAFGKDPSFVAVHVLLILAVIHTSILGVSSRSRTLAFSTTAKSQNRVVSESTGRSSSSLAMGLLDSVSNFLNKREGDFVKLDRSETEFGPGPLLLLYKVPAGVTNDEVIDMISDGAPIAFKKGVAVSRIASDEDELMDISVTEALERVLSNRSKSEQSAAEPQSGCPVLFFSGFSNEEMLNTYNIMGREIYEETGGVQSPACAKAVPNAMEKPLRQVLEEISSDHMDAMSDEQ